MKVKNFRAFTAGRCDDDCGVGGIAEGNSWRGNFGPVIRGGDSRSPYSYLRSHCKFNWVSGGRD